MDDLRWVDGVFRGQITRARAAAFVTADSHGDAPPDDLAVSYIWSWHLTADLSLSVYDSEESFDREFLGFFSTDGTPGAANFPLELFFADLEPTVQDIRDDGRIASVGTLWPSGDSRGATLCLPPGMAHITHALFTALPTEITLEVSHYDNDSFHVATVKIGSK